MRFRLQNYPIEVLCPDDLNLHIEVEENGSTAVENALIKASAYYGVVEFPTIAGDSGVVLTGVAEEDQLSTFHFQLPTAQHLLRPKLQFPLQLLPNSRISSFRILRV